MTPSNSAFLTLAGAAMLLVPVQAQDYLAFAPAKKAVKIEVDATDADFAIVLLADSNRVRPLDSEFVLADAEVKILTKPEKGKFVLDMEVPDSFLGAIYWQAVTHRPAYPVPFAVMPVHELQIGDVVEHGNELQIGDVVAPDDVQTKADHGQESPDGKYEADSDADLPRRAGKDVLATKYKIEMTLVRDDTGRAQALLARFEAPSDGYDLLTVRVDEYDGSTDIYLYRKLPGEGEGMLDIVEMHETKASLGYAPHARVFLAEGTSATPGAALAFVLIAEFQL